MEHFPNTDDHSYQAHMSRNSSSASPDDPDTLNLLLWPQGGKGGKRGGRRTRQGVVTAAQRLFLYLLFSSPSGPS